MILTSDSPSYRWAIWKLHRFWATSAPSTPKWYSPAPSCFYLPSIVNSVIGSSGTCPVLLVLTSALLLNPKLIGILKLDLWLAWMCMFRSLCLPFHWFAPWSYHFSFSYRILAAQWIDYGQTAYDALASTIPPRSRGLKSFALILYTFS